MIEFLYLLRYFFSEKTLPLLEILSSFSLLSSGSKPVRKSEDMEECRCVFPFSLLILFYFSTG